MNYQQQYPVYPGQPQFPPLQMQQMQQMQSTAAPGQFRPPMPYPPGPPPSQPQPSPQVPMQPSVMTPQNLTALMQQGYLQQQQMIQQQQAAQHAGGAQRPPIPMGGGGVPGMPQGMAQANMQMAMQHAHQASATASGSGTGSRDKKKKHRPAAPPSMQRPTQARPHEAYVKQAMMPPKMELEPWADALDELDHRELAMQRFRQRQDILGEIFGPERIKDIPLGPEDAWAGLGMDGETLEAKVLALEKENSALQDQSTDGVEGWKRHLSDIAEGKAVVA